MRRLLKTAVPISLLLIFSMAATVAAAAPTNADGTIIGDVPAQHAEYMNYSGEIETVSVADKNMGILVKNDANEIYFHITGQTLILDGNGKKINASSLEKGQKILLAYPANAPATASLPPQITPEIAILLPSLGFVKVDKFDKDWLSSDGELKLNMSDGMQIQSVSGKRLPVADANGKTLAVYYIIATMSIPPQTPPTLVIVLNDEVKTPSAGDTDMIPDDSHISLEDGDVISDTTNVAPDDLFILNPYIRDGTAMIPLRKAAEKYGYEIEWNADIKTVTLRNAAASYTITIGELAYGYNRSVRYFQTPPEIVNDRCYVPTEFLDNLVK